MKLDLLLWGQLELMKMLLVAYLDCLSRPGNAQHGVWGAMSLEVAKMAEWGSWLAHQLKLWMHTFIANHNSLPQNCYGQWNTSLLEDEDLA